MAHHSPPDEIERIDLDAAEDPRDVVHRTVAALAHGEPVVTALGGLDGILVNPLSCGFLPALSESGGGGDEFGRGTLLVRGSEELADWVPGRSHVAERLAR